MKDIMEALMKKEELIPDEHDGSYELVRETVKALSTVTVDNLKVEDLNLLYFSTVGTFRRSYKHKKLCINNSSLSTFEKERLHGILKRIREKANNGDYSSHGKSDHMGMFGTGIGKLRVSEENSKKFIKLCIDILAMDDEDSIINTAEPLLKSYMKGLGVASISQILHCLKPYVFPILNNGTGWGIEAYKNLGIKLIKPKETIHYIENTKRIKKFRDENFKFKNYRIFDMFFDNYSPPPPPLPVKGKDPYTKEMFLEEAFIDKRKCEEIRYSLDAKKNIILQGPPGTGKTFVAKRIAYLSMGCKDNDKIEMVQFHQSYSYEDFVQGVRLAENGSFELKNGIFYNFCKKAKEDHKSNYFFIIDEINRGNLSKIFGRIVDATRIRQKR